MSAFKRLKNSDVFTIPYVAHKNWTFNYSSAPTVSGYIVYYEGQNVTGSFNVVSDPTTSLGTYKRLLYNQINQLFYQQYPTNSLASQSLLLTIDNYYSASAQRQTNSFFNYNENPSFNPVFTTASNDIIGVYSISKQIYGERIIPTTFKINIPVITGSYADDGYGNIFFTNSSSITSSVGNIYYSHGLVILNNTSITSSAMTMSFQGEYTIWENYVSCTSDEREHNLTYNPSLQTNGTGSVLDFATGSNFTPYVTTVGLYNDNNELLMVAKLAAPIMVSSETDQTFLIRYDT